jgi:DNA-binding transcriptional LysR family regulator
MDLNHLKIFADVSRVGSYAALSREDGTDPSAISRTIASLESELGFRLFERTTRRLSLTQAGKIYLDHITPLLEGLTTARDLAKDTMKAP